ncbi:DUF4145 domain-containing protein [Xanthomonadaceae bacterium XH05]|nr:DUF4145 domain-containing protein [Xanthomonadaceae bacterium XH05]
MLIECHNCRARVEAEIVGEHTDDDFFVTRTFLLKCLSCKSSIIAESSEDLEDGNWTKPIRVYPSPKRHLGNDIPKTVKASIEEAERCMQAGAYLAATAMCGRAIEAICRAHGTKDNYLAGGLKELRDKSIIDTRLYEWGEELRDQRNDAAHATEAEISARDATDVVTFTYAFIDYVYLLAKKFEQFKARKMVKAKKAAKSSAPKA